MNIDLQVKKSEKLNAKINKLFSQKESIIKEMKKRKTFLYSFLEKEINDNNSYENSIKISKLFKELNFLADSINKLEA